jgi:hypothetical protein
MRGHRQQVDDLVASGVSVEAITWALKQEVQQSSAKFVLVVLANCASGDGDIAFPSIPYIATSTSQDRKTVVSNLKKLCESGLISDTGKRVGQTKQVIVYKLHLAVSAEEKRNSSENGTVPKTEGNSTVFPCEESRFSLETVPKTVHGTVREPSVTVKSNQKKAHAPLVNFDLSSWPSDPDPKLLAGWLAVRRKKRAEVTDIVLGAMGKQLHLAAAIGWTVDECMTECVLRNWQALKAEWLQPKATSGGGGAANRPLEPTSKTGAAIFKLQGIINGNQLDRNRDREGLAGPALLELGPSAGS